MCLKETPQWDAPFKQTKHIFARKPAIQLKYALTFIPQKLIFCVPERDFSMRRPFQAHMGYSCLKNTNTSLIHTQTSKQSNIIKTFVIYQNIKCSGCSKETPHRDAHLSTQNIVHVLINRWTSAICLPSKRMFCVFKRNVFMRGPFKHTKDILARKTPI